MRTTTLYRPVGIKELALIVETEFRAFPDRLPHQPIFYPVLNEDYAIQIARDWNTKDETSGFAGIVLALDVDAEYVGRYQLKTVGDSMHQELWVPAEDLEEFNRHVIGRIRIKTSFLAPNSMIPEQIRKLLETYPTSTSP